jgi:type VI secretion system Hcp family effector
MKTKTLFLVLALFMAFVEMSRGALDAYFRADGITGDVTRSGYTNYVAVSAYNHEVNAVRDSNGQPTGSRQHGPFKILKDISGNSPQFVEFMVRNRTIETADLLLYKPAINGVDTNYYSYHFEGVRIISIRNWSPNNNDATATKYLPMEEISFTYQTIHWESLSTGNTASDTQKN